jgi:transcriptional regulator with XRE-family HTH domain
VDTASDEPADPVVQMGSSEQALRSLGQMIRELRTATDLTQNALGSRAGIVGKYVSEIERGTRDVPFSTLHAIVEDGLDLRLDVQFRPRGPGRSLLASALPRHVNEVARAIAELPADQLSLVVTIARSVVKLARG